MSDFKFDCPKCGQAIVCDTSNAGMQIPCPVCQTPLTVPKPPAPPPPATPAGGTKLSINKAAHAPAKPAPAAGESHAPAGGWGPKAATATTFAKPRRKGTPKWVQYVLYTVIFLAAAGGGFYGYTKYAEKKAQEKAVADAAQKAAEEAAAKQAAEEAAKARARRASWKLDLADTEFPDRPASGKIHGVDFAVEEVLLQGNVLILRQQTGSARQMLIYLPIKSGDPIAGKTFEASSTNTQKSPNIVMNWKDDATGKPGTLSFNKGYGMKLQFGETNDGKIPASIYLSVPDPEQSFVAGHFDIGGRKVAGQPVMGQPPAGEMRTRKPVRPT
jgi:hypothetical protein